MSYLSELIHKRISAAQFLAKSAKYLSTKTGFAPTDAQVDAVVSATDKVTDDIETAIAAYLSAHLPALPAAIAVSATTAALGVIDAAIAGAGNVIKDNN